MQPPTRFREGFTARTVAGAFFVGFIMMPGAIYMGLIAGASLGAAAEWVTIILFSELARRSFSSLTRQEIYLIYYIAGGLAGVIGGTHVGRGAVWTTGVEPVLGAVAGRGWFWHCRAHSRMGCAADRFRCADGAQLFAPGVDSAGGCANASGLAGVVAGRVVHARLHPLSGHVRCRALALSVGTGRRAGSDGSGRGRRGAG